MRENTQQRALSAPWSAAPEAARTPLRGAFRERPGRDAWAGPCSSVATECQSREVGSSRTLCTAQPQQLVGSCERQNRLRGKTLRYGFSPKIKRKNRLTDHADGTGKLEGVG